MGSESTSECPSAPSRRIGVTLSHRLHLPPFWTLPLSVLAGIGVVTWHLSSGPGGVTPWLVLRSLLWPGLPVAAAVYAFAWLGWALDIG